MSPRSVEIEPISSATSPTLPADSVHLSIRKTPTFRDAIIGLPAKWSLRNLSWNSIVHDDTSLPRSKQCFWLVESLIHPGRIIAQIWIVTRHQKEISSLVSQTSVAGKPVVPSRNVGCCLMLTCHVMHNYFNSLPDHCDPLLAIAPSIGRGISSLLGCCNGDNPRTEFSVAALKEHRSTIFNHTS